MSFAATSQASGLSFDRAEALIFDPIPANRTAARGALGMIGFQKIVATSERGDLSQFMRERTFDLLFADITQETAATCAVVRSIRDGTIESNPFMHIVLTSWKLDSDVVERGLNCGADDLVTRPFSVDFLGARIRAHTQARKAFVVTSDYIGPDRRRHRPPGKATNLFDVPNLMLRKARDPNWSDETTKAALAEVKSSFMEISSERARRSAFQIAFLTEYLLETLKASAKIDIDLEKFEAVLKDVAFRSRDGDPAIATTTGELLEYVGHLRTGDTAAFQSEKMHETAGALLVSVNPTRNRDDLLREVTTSVAAAMGRALKDQKIA